MTCTCILDSKLFLEYLKVILTFPTVVLILSLVVLRLYGSEIRKLFGRVNKVGSVELSPTEAAIQIQRKISEIDKEQQPIKEALDTLPNGQLKERLQHAQEKSREAKQQLAISRVLNENQAYPSLSDEDKLYIKKYISQLPAEPRLGINHHILYMQGVHLNYGSDMGIVKMPYRKELRAKDFREIYNFIETLGLTPRQLRFDA